METIEIIVAGYSYTGEFINNNIGMAREAGIDIIVSDNNEGGFPYKERKGLKYLKNNENKGYSYALNRGFSLSDSRYVLLCNDDIVLSEGFLKKLKSRIPFYDSIGAGIIGFRMIEGGKNGRSVYKCDYSPLFIMYAFSILPHILSLFSRNSGYMGTGETMHYSKSSKFVKGVSGACMLVKSDLYRVLQGFDEEYFLTYEETDFFMRARKIGAGIYYDNGLYVHHQHSITNTYDSKSFSFKSMKVFLKKNYGQSVYMFIETWITAWAILKWVLTGNRREYDNIRKA